MKCHSLFFGKNKKKYFKMFSAEIFNQHAIGKLQAPFFLDVTHIILAPDMRKIKINILISQ